MPVFNYPKKEVNVKIVYYGPGLSGKTTNLQKIHDGIKPERRGKLVSLATQTDRTLFFDFMPLELGSIGGYKVRLHLYTVPGQVHYNATRKLVLKGVDGVVFVADSQKAMTDANVESIHNLEKNLQSYGKSLAVLPHIIQANKRDLGEVIPLQGIDSYLNHHGAQVIQAVASEGKGVMETLTEIIRMVIKGLRDQFVTEEDMAQPSPEPEQIPAPARTEPGRSVEEPVPESSAALQAAPAPEPEPEPEPEQSPEPARAEPGGSVNGSEPETEPEAPSPGAVADKPGPVAASSTPVTVSVPVEGLGTVELTLEVSGRFLDGGEDKTVEVQVTGAAFEGTTPESAHQPEPEPEPTSAPEPDIDHEAVTEHEPLAAPEEPMETLPLDKDLPPLEEAHDEPLGAPLDGQEPDDLAIPDLPQEEKILLEEEVSPATSEESAAQTSVEGAAPPEPPSGYDPTVQSVEFDFPEAEPEEEAPKKKGWLGRFKRK